MAPPTPEMMAERRRATLETAAVLLEDIEFLRQALISPDPSVRDVRTISAVLRRLLVDGALVSVASPRLGKIELLAPDLKPLQVSNRTNEIPFFVAGGVELFGVLVAAGISERTPKPRELGDYHPDKTLFLSLESFLKQGVICFEGVWISRRQVIKYVANVAGGVHAGKDADDTDRLIRRSRHAWSINLESDVPTIAFNNEALSAIELPAIVDRSRIDAVLLEVFAAASFLVRSPDISRLEAAIGHEL